MLIGCSNEQFRVTNSIVFLLFRYQSCHHFGRPKVAQYSVCTYPLVRNKIGSQFFAICCICSCCSLYVVQNQGNPGLKECALKVQYTVYLACLAYCLSSCFQTAAPFFRPRRWISNPLVQELLQTP